MALALVLSVGPLGDAVGEIVEEVEPGDALLLQEEERVALVLAEHGHQAGIIGARQSERIEADRETLHLRNHYCQVAE